MPTSGEFKELCENTYNQWIEENGVNGWKFTNKKDSDKYIFLPAAGFGRYKTLYPGTQAVYMSSTLSPESPDCICVLIVGNEVKEISLDAVRFCGYPIRPVTEVSELH